MTYHDPYGQGGPGWQHQGGQPPAPPPPPDGGWARRAVAAFRRWPLWVQVPLAVFAGLFLIGLVASPFIDEEPSAVELDASRRAPTVTRSSTSAPGTTARATTTTAEPTTTTTEPTTTTAEPTTTTTEPTTTTAEPTTTTRPTTTTTAPTTTAPPAPDEPREDEATGEDVWSVGQTAHTGDLDVVVHQVVDPWTSANEFDVPAEGNRFVAVEVEARNTSDDTHTIATFIDVELTDSLHRAYTVALAGVGLQDLGGDIQPGGTRRGWVVFEVPSDASGLRFRIKGNLTATGSLFDLSTA